MARRIGPSEGEIIYEYRSIMNVGVTFTDIEIFSRRLSVTDAKALLSILDRTEVLQFCAVLNAINEVTFEPGRAWNTSKHENVFARLLHDLLPPVFHARAWRLFKTSRPFAPFVPAAIRALMKQACVWCPSDGGKSLKALRYRQNVTKVLFALQGALLPEVRIDAMTQDWIQGNFPAFVRSIQAGMRLNMGHDLGRLHAFVTQPAVAEMLPGGMSVDRWFFNQFGVNAAEYRSIAQALVGYSGTFSVDNPRYESLWLDLERFSSCFQGKEDRVRSLIELVETTVEKVISAANPNPCSLAELIYDKNDEILVRPLIRVGNRWLVSSFDTTFAKLVRGLPYLAMAAAERAGMSGRALEAARAAVGHMFESYAAWLAREWFTGSEVKIITRYRIAADLPKGRTDPERDLLLILGEVAVPIEIKAKVPSRPLRSSGDLELMTKFIGEMSRQAITAAEALVSGNCVTQDGTPIPAVQKAFPCILVFEHFPVRPPFSDALEPELEKQLGKRVFLDSNDVGPLQVLDIDQYEDWDKAYRLPEEASKLMQAIQGRALMPLWRYQSLIAIRQRTEPVTMNWPSLLERLCDESEVQLRRDVSA